MPVNFIVGCPRSGTTLQTILLDCFPGCRTGKIELGIMPKLLSNFNHFKEDYVTKALGDNCYRNFIRSAVYSFFDKEEVFFIKDLANTFFIKEIKEIFPESKFLYMLRNPFDVIRSMLDAFQNKQSGVWPSNVIDAANLWNRYLDINYDLIDLIVRYEDLTSNPVATMKKIFDCLGMSFTDQVIHDVVQDVAKSYGPIPKKKSIHSLLYNKKDKQIITNICDYNIKKFNYLKENVIILFTGLSGVGKSTLGNRLHVFLDNHGINNSFLDGDNFRANINKGLGFSKEDRIENIRRIGYVAKELSKNNIISIISAIAPYRESREYLRSLGCNFVEIYLKSDMNILIDRDTKGLYKKAINGEIKNFTGVNDPYEEPLNAEIVIDTGKLTEDESFNIIIDYLIKNFYV